MCIRDRLISGDVKTNLVEHLNINNNNWIRVPVGASCKATLSAEYTEDAAQKTITPVSYTHLDVYKRQ